MAMHWADKEMDHQRSELVVGLRSTRPNAKKMGLLEWAIVVFIVDLLGVGEGVHGGAVCARVDGSGRMPR